MCTSTCTSNGALICVCTSNRALICIIFMYFNRALICICTSNRALICVCVPSLSNLMQTFILTLHKNKFDVHHVHMWVLRVCKCIVHMDKVHSWEWYFLQLLFANIPNCRGGSLLWCVPYKWMNVSQSITRRTFQSGLSSAACNCLHTAHKGRSILWLPLLWSYSLLFYIIILYAFHLQHLPILRYILCDATMRCVLSLSPE